ncbi:MAG: host specificity protein J, partial [Candidatus Riflebacteria bacterium]|nr:host specificity protein J [Candidatus Riflebacteria bacterium]
MVYIIKGSGGGGKSGGGSGGKESPNTLRSRNLIKFIDLIGEGEIVGLEQGGKDIYFDETPLQNTDGTYNFDGIFWESRAGLPDQPCIAGFPSAERDINVNQEVTKKNGPVVRQTESNKLDAVRVTMTIPSLNETNTKNGNTTGSSVRFKIYVKNNTDADYILKLDKTISGKCVSTYQESYRINLNGEGPYLVKVERVTNDSEKSTLNNKTYLSSITELMDVKLTYPNCAYVGISYNSDQLSGTTPTRKYIVKGLKVQVPSNYDPETRFYDGAWDGSFKLAYTNNPAWCLYDMIVNNRYGLGDSVMENQVDKFAFYTVGKYCDDAVSDGFGSYEPRFTLNTCINSREDCYSLLNKMASVFRGMIYQYEQLITISQDSPKEVSAIYTPANVINGLFTYEGSSIYNRPTVITVSYLDEDLDFSDAVETVQDDDAIYKYGWNQQDLSGFGCTSRGQAHRLADWYMYTELKEKEMVSFSVGLDSVFVRPGDVVRIVDPSYMGARYGGRIKGFTSDTITLDSPV